LTTLDHDRPIQGNAVGDGSSLSTPLLPYQGTLESDISEVTRPMNPTSIARSEGSAGASLGDQLDFQETRLWDRARSNLMLLYGGRRGGSIAVQGVANNGANSLFGNVDLKI